MNTKVAHKSFIVGILSVITAVLVGLCMLTAGGTTVKAEDVTSENYLTVKGVKDYDGVRFESFAKVYETLKPKFEKLGLGQEVASEEQFKSFFTDIDKNMCATLTYTVHGTIVYDENGLEHLLTMGRSSSHYSNGHLISFKFVGAEENRASTLTVNSDITLPYEWWGEKITTSISFENLTINGSAPSGLYTTQACFESIDFTVSNCALNGIKIYNCSNVGGSYTIKDSTLDGSGSACNAYAIHLQGHKTEQLNIAIYNNNISGYDRGINIDQSTAKAVIDHNKISINDKTRSCVQITQCNETTVAKNTLTLNGGNAVTLHGALNNAEVVVDENTIAGTAGYLFYDDTKDNAGVTLVYGYNEVDDAIDQTKGIYKGETKAVGEFVAAAIAKNYAAIGDTEYKTLGKAIRCAENNDTITLLDNFKFNKGMRYANPNAEDDRYIITGKDLTIDLNGYTLTNPYELEPTQNFTAITVGKLSTLVMMDSSENKSGTLQSGDEDTMGTYLFNVLGGGKLIIESGNYFGGGTVAQAQKGTVEVKGGTFDAKSFGASYGYNYMFNCVDAAYKDGTAKIIISGGTFNHFNPADNGAEGACTSFVANGYKAVEISEGVYEVIEKSIKGANVSLGSDIALNFYTVKDGKMTATYKDSENNEKTVELVKIADKNGYKFTFSGITPQMVDRNLTVKFYIDENFDEDLEYSVLAYCKSVLDENSSDETLKALIGDLLYYGVAAKNYRGMDSSELENEIVNLGLSASSAAICESELKATGEKSVITSATIKLASDNRIILKIKKADFNENYKFTVDGSEIVFTENAGYYEYESDGIKALNFGKQLIVTVTEDGAEVQKIMISVNDYCALSEDKEIALATYRYGASAKNYANKNQGD